MANGKHPIEFQRKTFFDRFHKKDHLDAFIGPMGIKANVHILKIMVEMWG
jgi:hypothetical protein